jgi:hypothetical protein
MSLESTLERLSSSNYPELITITAKSHIGEYRLHTPVRFGESTVLTAQHYDDEISSLIGDDTGWPYRIRCGSRKFDNAMSESYDNRVRCQRRRICDYSPMPLLRKVCVCLSD